MGTDALRRGTLKGGFVAELPYRCGRGVLGSFFMGPRMARQASSLLLVAGLMTWAGCAEQPVVDQLPPANFNGPIVPAPPPPVAHVAKPAPKSVPIEVKKPAPQVASIPREWIPNATKSD